MTDLRKPVRRRTSGVYDHSARRIVVILEPGDVIAMREERGRKLFSASIPRIFRQLIIWNVEAERAAKRAARRAQ